MLWGTSPRGKGVGVMVDIEVDGKAGVADMAWMGMSAMRWAMRFVWRYA